MGGISHGSPARNKATGNLKFWGSLSMENNGGFATIRTEVDAGAFTGAKGVHIKVKGDGRQYKFMAMKEGKGRYQIDLDTVAGEETDVQIHFKDMEYWYWGWKKDNMPGLEGGDVVAVGFMIADKNETPFELEIMTVSPIFDSVTENVQDSPGNSQMSATNMDILDMDWYSLNDGVMGGVSRGLMKNRKFHGQLSLENNGGFSTTRVNIPNGLTGIINSFAKKGVYFFYLGAKGIEISYKGDGREYKLNLAKSDSDWNLNQWTYVLPKTNILTSLFSE